MFDRASPTQVGYGVVAKIRLGWKGWPGTNTLSYCSHFKIMNVKSFIILAPGVKVLKRFLFVADADGN
jgi:hypothetical protein